MSRRATFQLMPSAQSLCAALALLTSQVPAQYSNHDATRPAPDPTGGTVAILVEAESFTDPGGWKLDTQFIDSMGSPYLLAHGLGTPVATAVTQVEVPAPGTYRVFVRTMDWVARWGAEGSPGRFDLRINGEALAPAAPFGTARSGATGTGWEWQDGGVVTLADAGAIELRLEDRSGFDGRCDAILLTNDLGFEPTDDDAVLPEWRRQLLNLPAEPTRHDGYDLVIVGGGYAGMGAAIAAARLGCKVALIQNRGVLGGNGSSEVRVWSKGEIRRGRFPRIGEIVEEFADNASRSPGRAQEFGDAKKESVIRAEANIDLYLHHHMYDVETSGTRVTAVTALDTRTSARRTFSGRCFVDATGHGSLGAIAGADVEMTPRGRMGMSNMWRWARADAPRAFPKTPWALPLTMRDFPYPRDHHGEWFWESGFDKDPLQDAEGIRDWNLRAVYGAFHAMKHGAQADKHRNAYLTWVAYIGGTRESRRLLGDVVLTQDDVVDKRAFEDGCVPSTWSIDLHYPKPQFAKKFPDNPFISVAEHDQRVDRTFGYPVPYRCFYSRNIDNLFMAGRCISVTHEALGTVRVMRTCGMMGEVVGKAASLCAQHDCTPREVHGEHLDELLELLRLPGSARRVSLDAELVIPANAIAAATASGGRPGRDATVLSGTVVDGLEATWTGSWTHSTGVPGYVGDGYRYANADSGADARFSFTLPAAGRYEVRVFYGAHSNRGTTVPIEVHDGQFAHPRTLDMRKSPGNGGWVSLGHFELPAAKALRLTIGTMGAGGVVHADAIQIVAAPR